jgi:hypothetical protein
MTNRHRSKFLEWAEEHGHKNLEERISTLESKANNVMTFLLAAIGASLASGVRAFEEAAGPVVFASAWLCGYLILVAIAFATKVMRARPIPAVYCEPNSLLQHVSRSVDDIRDGLLDDVQSRIDAAIKRNQETARWINGVIVALIFSPAVFVLAAFYRGA